ncbi:toprim domain-containing protein [Desulfofustis glycolicus]|uniref:DNA primase catalytic core, N-terminal domain n=1 Tax=Desulfofustis glycolicus DSM 9705 TaxID=1121409 RepID=A0A1M5RUM4_9BACT|nr:toprim domain-containing protein [Desulfofustis glycolicus]SHH30032.1 DNA primase catalytic core, N-terminal domain [Desulfofustis glycolicus DSM 9705]
MTDNFALLKEKTDLVDYIVGRTGGTSKKVGAHTVDIAPCPLCGGHDCFRITVPALIWHCYQCPTEKDGGDVFDFIEFFDRCDKAEALKILAKHHGYELTAGATRKTTRSAKEKDGTTEQSAIFEAAAAYYHDALLSNSQELGYQKKVRRHTDATLAAFRVGYADGRLHELLKSAGYAEDQLTGSGLVKNKDGTLCDFFIGGLFVYPHVDPQGRVAGFTTKDRRKKYTYRLPGEHWGAGCLFFNMPAFKGKEVLLVEGENDLLSVHGRGGYQHVAAINGQISRAQLDYLTDWAPGKTLYLCFDNDDAGRTYTDKVCSALKKLCLPGTLAKLLQEQAVEVRIVRFDPEAKDIDDHLKGQKEPVTALKALLKGAERYFPPLRSLKDIYSTWISEPGQERKFDFDTYGKICFEWFRASGKFFIDGEACHLYFNNWIYQIGNNTPFKALLYHEAGINAATNGARLIIQNIESQAYLKGDHTSIPGWIFTNFKESTVYFNLCGEYNNLLKIGPGKIEVVPNGTNAERVLLRSSPKMHPLRFIPNADIRKGMTSLKTHIFDNLACDNADRYFVVCLLFNVVLLQYIKARGITKFSGTKGCGKTSAASMLSTVIYGEDCVTTGSAASDFSEAAISPLTISDNLESDAVRGGKRDFLLTAATGITRQKRKAGSDSDNVYERSCTQLLVTSIEPFVEPELIERTNEILFDKRFHNPAFKEAVAVEADLREARDLIWSAVFKIIAHDILPNIAEKKADTLKVIRTDYPNHSKSRLNELYAMLYLILVEVVKYIPRPGHVKGSSVARMILNEWIVAQNERSYATERESNKILYGLEALLSEYEFRPTGFELEYGLKAADFKNSSGMTEQIIFEATTGELYRAFDYLAKTRGITNQFRSASQLGARIGDSLEILERADWTVKRSAVINRGTRKHHFVRRFVRHSAK